MVTEDGTLHFFPSCSFSSPIKSRKPTRKPVVGGAVHGGGSLDEEAGKAQWKEAGDWTTKI